MLASSQVACAPAPLDLECCYSNDVKEADVDFCDGADVCVSSSQSNQFTSSSLTSTASALSNLSPDNGMAPAVPDRSNQQTSTVVISCTSRAGPGVFVLNSIRCDSGSSSVKCTSLLDTGAAVTLIN